jgi:hypothetical protein
VSRRRDNAIRQEKAKAMETPVQQITAVQHPSNAVNGAGGGRRSESVPMIQAVAAYPTMLLGVYRVMELILQRLRQASTLGPLSVLAILLIYSLLSPHLPEVYRQYVHQILH